MKFLFFLFFIRVSIGSKEQNYTNAYEIESVLNNKYNLTIFLKYAKHADDIEYCKVIKRPLFIVLFQTTTEFEIKIIDQDKER